jgi:hypothetical protein
LLSDREQTAGQKGCDGADAPRSGAPTARSNTRPRGRTRPSSSRIRVAAVRGGQHLPWPNTRSPVAGLGMRPRRCCMRSITQGWGYRSTRTARRLPLLRCREGRAAVARPASGWTRERMQICSPPGRRQCTRWPTWRRLRYGRDVPRRAVRLECRLPASASAHGRPAHGQVDRETACLSSRQRQPAT